MAQIKMRVKSEEKLHKYFEAEGYRPYTVGGGYLDRENNVLINTTMLALSVEIIEVTPLSDNDYYNYSSNDWYWHKDWLEPLNLIWLPLKETK